MGAMASEITRLMVVYTTVYSGADQRKHQSSASLALVRGIHGWPVNSPHKGPVTRKLFPLDESSWICSCAVWTVLLGKHGPIYFAQLISWLLMTQATEITTVYNQQCHLYHLTRIFQFQHLGCQDVFFSSWIDKAILTLYEKHLSCWWQMKFLFRNVEWQSVIFTWDTSH